MNRITNIIHTLSSTHHQKAMPVRKSPNDPEARPLLPVTPLSSSESLGEGPKHKHGKGTGKGARIRDAHARDETHDDNYRPEWAPNPHNKDEEKYRPRTLIVCFDGTGDQFDSDVSLNEPT